MKCGCALVCEENVLNMNMYTHGDKQRKGGVRV